MSPSTSRDTAVKWSAYALAALLLLMLHSFTAARFRIGGVMPFLPPLLAATVASMEEPLPGALFGLVLGVLSDLALTSPLPCLYTLTFVAAALLASAIAKSLLQPGFLCSLAVSAAAFVLIDLLLFAVFLSTGRATFSAFLARAVLELLLSLPLLTVCHPVLHFVHRRFTL